MYRKTVVVLPPNIEHDEEVREWLEENPGAWRPALDLEVFHIDPRANFIDCEVEQLTVDAGQVDVQYVVDFYIHYGCRDIEGAGQDHREIGGEVLKGAVVFQTFQQPEPLAPDEEL